MKNPLIKSCYLAAFMALSSSSHSDIVVVGNMNSPEISKTLAKQIFFKKVNTLPNGEAAIPIDLSDNNETKWDFYRKISGKDPADIHSYWSRAVFTGGGSPPDQVDSVEELRRRMSKSAGVIGYIDEKDIVPGMKILLRLAI